MNYGFGYPAFVTCIWIILWAYAFGTTIYWNYSLWASRYGIICRFGRPFNAAIHAATRNLRSQVRNRFPVHIKRAIRIWRALTVLVGLDEQRVVRSLGTFALPDPHIIAWTDASLIGVGVLIFRRCKGRDVFLGTEKLGSLRQWFRPTRRLYLFFNMDGKRTLPRIYCV